MLIKRNHYLVGYRVIYIYIIILTFVFVIVLKSSYFLNNLSQVENLKLIR